jgi:hypothetical protein
MSYPPQGLDKKDVLANQTTQIADLEILKEHVHSVGEVAPWGSAPITLTSGAGAYTWGDYSDDIIAANEVTEIFDIHYAIISSVSENADFEVELVYGASDTVAAEINFRRTNAFTSSIDLKVMTPRISANSRVRARMRDSAGNEASAAIKVKYHTYD